MILAEARRIMPFNKKYNFVGTVDPAYLIFWPAFMVPKIFHYHVIMVRRLKEDYEAGLVRAGVLKNTSSGLAFVSSVEKLPGTTPVGNEFNIMQTGQIESFL